MANRDDQHHEQHYEGRRLPRPDEEIVDQGLAFDVQTLLGRRQVLRFFGVGAGAGAVALGLSACGAGSTATSSGDGTATAPSSTSPTATASSSTSSTATATAATEEIPDETAGPYPGDGSNGVDVLSESGIVRSDLRSSFGDASGTAEGVPMTLTLTITDLANGGTPFVGVAVYVWHCNRDGEYSLYSSPIADQNYLRGVQVTDAKGQVSFTSIFPACYSGRWPHIHFEVYPDAASITDATNAIATSQVALPQATCETVYATTGYEQSVSNLSQVSLTSDGVFGDDGGVLELATVTGSVSKGLTVALTAPVDTTTTPTAGSAPGSGPGGAPPAG